MKIFQFTSEVSIDLRQHVFIVRNSTAGEKKSVIISLYRSVVLCLHNNKDSEKYADCFTAKYRQHIQLDEFSDSYEHR